MHQMVKDYLQNQEKERAQKSLQAKNELLFNLGLYEKEYYNGSEYSSQYPNSEWNNETRRQEYYKIKPIEVSDDDYNEIMKYQDKVSSRKRNALSTVFTVMACVIFVCGFVMGIVYGNAEAAKSTYYTYTETEFSFTVTLIYWIISFVVGMLFLGFAEVIKLLSELNNK